MKQVGGNEGWLMVAFCSLIAFGRNVRRFIFRLRSCCCCCCFLGRDQLAYTNSTLYHRIGPQWLSELRRLWPNVLWWVACELGSAQRVTLEKNILPPRLPGFELATFRSRVRRSTNKQSRWNKPIVRKCVENPIVSLHFCVFSKTGQPSEQKQAFILTIWCRLTQYDWIDCGKYSCTSNEIMWAVKKLARALEFWFWFKIISCGRSTKVLLLFALQNWIRWFFLHYQINLLFFMYHQKKSTNKMTASFTLFKKKEWN